MCIGLENPLLFFKSPINGGGGGGHGPLVSPPPSYANVCHQSFASVFAEKISYFFSRRSTGGGGGWLSCAPPPLATPVFVIKVLSASLLNYISCKVLNHYWSLIQCQFINIQRIVYIGLIFQTVERHNDAIIVIIIYINNIVILERHNHTSSMKIINLIYFKL